jgi:hypothetical protein
VYADRIVQHLGLAAHLAGIYGTELEGRFDGDKTELLAHLLAVEGIAAALCPSPGDLAACLARITG